MTYLFAYDISDARRRKEVSKTLERFGLRVQKSFFQCDVPSSMAEEIKRVLLAIIDEKEDSLALYPLCSDCLRGARTHGTGALAEEVSFEIL
jgi:CRISPR-associated protein Cas2